MLRKSLTQPFFAVCLFTILTCGTVPLCFSQSNYQSALRTAERLNREGNYKSSLMQYNKAKVILENEIRMKQKQAEIRRLENEDVLSSAIEDFFTIDAVDVVLFGLSRFRKFCKVAKAALAAKKGLESIQIIQATIVTLQQNRKIIEAKREKTRLQLIRTEIPTSQSTR